MVKKLLIVLGVIAGGGLWFLWLLGGDGFKSLSVKPGLSAAVSDSKLPAKRPVIDSDGDQIPDWEEKLRGTDTHNPDSDGNHILDGQERPKTADEAALQLIRQAMVKKQNPLLSVENLTGDTAFAYQLADLNLGEGGDSAFKIYGQNLVQIMSPFKNPSLGYEVGLVLQVAEQGNLTVTNQIKQATERYQAAIKALLTLRIPSDIAQIHLNLINGLARLQSDSLLMAQIATEPTLALGGANLAPGHLRQLLADISNLNLFLAAHNLTLENSPSVKITLGL